MARPVQVSREVHPANRGVDGRLLLGDAVARLNELLPEYEGQIKLIYMDPPFMTGDRFFMRVRLGAAGWRKNAGTVPIPTCGG